jgi:hypothetical protein
MSNGFILELFDPNTGKFIGGGFDGSHLSNHMPQVGDTIIAPESKRDLKARDPAKHFAYKILSRYFVPEREDKGPIIVKLFAKRRKLTSVEISLLPPASA